MAILSYKQIIYVDTFSGLPMPSDDKQIGIAADTGLTYQFSAPNNAWTPLGRTAIKRSTSTIDGKTVGNTKIYTLEPSGTFNFYPTQIILRAVNISGATLKPTISVGSNASSYDNIASGSLLNTVVSLTGITSQPMAASTSPALSGSTDIYCRVSIAAIATSFTFNVDVEGYYA